MRSVYGLPSLNNGMVFFLQRSGLSRRRHSIVYRRSPIRRFRGILPRALVHVSMAPPDARLSPVLSTVRTLPASYRRLFMGKNWTSSSILVHCDNEVTVHCINKGCSHSLALMPLLRRLIWISACDKFIITAKHIPGSKNLIADSLSRFMFQKFRALAPEADPSPTPVPHYSQLIQWVRKIFRPP